jgi:hypothetical protein
MISAGACARKNRRQPADHRRVPCDCVPAHEPERTPSSEMRCTDAKSSQPLSIVMRRKRAVTALGICHMSIFGQRTTKTYC